MKRKATLILITLLMLALATAGCAGPQATTTATTAPKATTAAPTTTAVPSIVTAPGTFPVVKEKQTLKIFAASDPITGLTDIATNAFTKAYEEKTNVKIVWEYVTGTTDQTMQLTNLKFASGDLPDVFMSGLNKSMQAQYGSKGTLIPLNKLIDQYSVHIKAAFAENPDVKPQFTAPDGNIYGLGNISAFYHGKYPVKMWINKPFLDKLSITAPDTTESFYQMLKAFKDKDPNGNGQKDEIPLAAKGTHIFTYLMNAFIYTSPGNDPWANNPGYVYHEGDKVVFIGDKPEFREGLRYIAKLFKEGLIAPDSFTIDAKQFQALGMQQVPVLGAASELFPGEFTIGRNKGDRIWDYIAIAPLKGPTGLRQAPERLFIYTGDRFSITKACKIPEVAIRWIDWIYTLEGTATAHYGPEMKTFDSTKPGWVRATAGQVGADGKPAIWTRFQPKDAPVNMSYGLRVLPTYLPMALNTGMIVDVANDYTSYLSIFLYDTTAKQYEPYGVNKTISDMFIPSDISSEFVELKGIIESEVDKAMATFALGSKSIETDWDAYISNLKKLGLDKYVELYQKVYSANNKK
jgi:putative aldouronate transport system substrate-binding protein